MKRLPMVLAVAVALLSVAVSPTRAGDDLTDSMARIVSSLGVLLPLSFDEAAWADPANAEAIGAALRQLVTTSDRVRDHATDREASFDHLAISLAVDAAVIEGAWRSGASDEARWRIQSMTETCIACHSRMPDLDDSELGRRITATVEVQKLDPRARAGLLAATRSWEEALILYEELLAPDQTARPSEAFWLIPDYLELCVRVKQDLARPAPILRAYARTEGLPVWMRDATMQWVAGLEDLAKREVTAGTELAVGRALIAEARTLDRFPADRTGLPHYLLASSLLHRATASGIEDPELLAETYYLLGLAESHVGVRGWLFQTEFYLEKAIRLAPHAAWAPGAFAALECHAAVTWAGPEGPELPADVRATLDELRQKVSEGR